MTPSMLCSLLKVVKTFKVINSQFKESYDQQNGICVAISYEIYENHQRHYEPQPAKTNKMTCVPSKDSDQPGPDHGSCENVSYTICEQQRCRSAYASAQSDQHVCFAA